MKTWIIGTFLLALAGSATAQDDTAQDDRAKTSPPKTNWVMREGAERPAGPKIHDVSPEQDPRYWSAVTKLTGAFNDEDLDAYLGLLSERYKTSSKFPLRDLMDFMSGVIATRGTVEKFHPLKPKAIELDDTAFPVRSFVFHLEDGTPGTFGISLDDDDKIDHLSLFVKSGICAHGSDCPEAAVKLDGDA